MDVIKGPIPPFFTFFIFSLALTNAAASIHSANIRGRLASHIQVDQDAAADNDFFLTTHTTADLIPSSFTLPPTTNTRHHQLAAAIMATDIFVREENHDRGHEQPQPLTVAAASAGACEPCTPRNKTNTRAITTFRANWVPLPTGITASPTTTTMTTPTTKHPAPATTHSFNPEASCMVAIFSLISSIPTPGPALSTALDKAKHALAPSAVAAPQCIITLPASLSSEYGVYTSQVDSWWGGNLDEDGYGYGDDDYGHDKFCEFDHWVGDDCGSSD
ncbi:hypothetical protein SMACR_00781 [Sordaria macrospora]|uniref:WGS project CABT00000000 data, contig 2.2 n=2 Tax=Sordaria macrospora TaxID=5147 RepID=F7VN21_SORMK|nr:uncharacterized protein SMAC_00781 [Sordaria macrospora k-hell]KAA8634737.1 hypothetical protein SMACR_00781 [Sordaria macrospora]KAH7631126.1 hypothetical protein B0T09DRAFT_408773 [Sordaria sp. MPI-SDFR-AT-0083]WPJ61773.1 hypothetical protein SMAC4_00781 [Sordaria macrospora]CCC06750.1 unnamed protein product [Sordaria macrospora k-hell]